MRRSILPITLFCLFLSCTSVLAQAEYAQTGTSGFSIAAAGAWRERTSLIGFSAGGYFAGRADLSFHFASGSAYSRDITQYGFAGSVLVGRNQSTATFFGALRVGVDFASSGRDDVTVYSPGASWIWSPNPEAKVRALPSISVHWQFSNDTHVNEYQAAIGIAFGSAKKTVFFIEPGAGLVKADNTTEGHGFVTMGLLL